MKINYSLSAIMKKGHQIASGIREEVNTYKEALSRGLRKAWAIAKGMMPNTDVEKVEVINSEIQQEWAYSCMTAKEVDVCEFEVARG